MVRRLHDCFDNSFAQAGGEPEVAPARPFLTRVARETLYTYMDFECYLKAFISERSCLRAKSGMGDGLDDLRAVTSSRLAVGLWMSSLFPCTPRLYELILSQTWPEGLSMPGRQQRGGSRETQGLRWLVKSLRWSSTTCAADFVVIWRSFEPAGPRPPA